MDISIIENYFKEWNRMCDMYNNCDDCPLGVFESCREKPNVDIVQNWSDEHPIKTRQSEFFKHYPKANHLDAETPCIQICPKYIEGDFPCSSGCKVCRKKYWLEEID